MTLLLRRPWIGPLLALLVLYALFCLIAPDTFPGSINLLTMARQTVVVAIAAVGMTYVILLGGIDLSVGSAVALTTVVVARALRAEMQRRIRRPIRTERPCGSGRPARQPRAVRI